MKSKKSKSRKYFDVILGLVTLLFITFQIITVKVTDPNWLIVIFRNATFYSMVSLLIFTGITDVRRKIVVNRAIGRIIVGYLLILVSIFFMIVINITYSKFVCNIIDDQCIRKIEIELAKKNLMPEKRIALSKIRAQEIYTRTGAIEKYIDLNNNEENTY